MMVCSPVHVRNLIEIGRVFFVVPRLVKAAETQVANLNDATGEGVVWCIPL